MKRGGPGFDVRVYVDLVGGGFFEGVFLDSGGRRCPFGVDGGAV
jgi:hypothetical protein